VKELADACSMSESHFRRIFIENMNMSPTDYLNFVRIQMACEMMKKSDEPIEHVAVKCGFTTQSTFNRNFRKYLDTSPYQWKTHPSNYASKLLKYNISAHRGW
jgi:AraC-like DNA-binding protein